MGTSQTVVTVYSVVSGFFFAACGYAQLNDPDPILWVTGYLLAGCAVNLLVRFNHQVIRLLVAGVWFGNAVVVAYFVREITPHLDFSLSPSSLAWSVLQLEEGRETVGLVLLLGHVTFLRSQCANPRAGKGTAEASSYSTSVQPAEPTGASKALMGVGALVGLTVVAGAIYLWIYYQPAMNAQHHVEHCSGQFHDGLKPEPADTVDNFETQRGDVIPTKEEL